MGCASSKQKRCRHCQSPYSPVTRSYSMHVHHPPQRDGDSYHMVALTSTTLGSLKLDSSNQNTHIEHNIVICNGNDLKSHEKTNGVVEEKAEKKQSKEFSMGLIEAKTWSTMIEEKIPKVGPKTPIRTPPGEPETINTWELMAGLEDTSPLSSVNHFRSFSFDVIRNPVDVSVFDRPKSRLQETSNGLSSPKPMWLQLANDDSNSNSKMPEFDPEVISSFRKSLESLSPDHPFHLRPPEKGNEAVKSDNELLDVTDLKKPNVVVSDYKCCKDKVVLYFTSLRGVRKTYEDCCHIRVILKGIAVRVDERDVSMHSGFKEELKELLGEGFNGGGLPRVFIGKKYIGGAEEIRRMHEDGQLEEVFERCEMVGDVGGEVGGACEACGDIRFVPCETCSGSCKVYYDVDDEEQEECEEDEFGFQRCPDCNENGLIRCPICCY